MCVISLGFSVYSIMSSVRLYIVRALLLAFIFDSFFFFSLVSILWLGLPTLLLLFSRYVASDSFATPWTIYCQASQSMGFPRQEYWSGLLFPLLEDLLDPGIKPATPALQADS